MKHNFERIEDWLHANASKIIELSLQPPASSNELEEFEKVVGKSIPEDFKELYRWRNGLSEDENLGSLFYGLDFYPIRRIVYDYLNRKENQSSQFFSLSKVDKEIEGSNVYNINWLKFGSDGGHVSLYLDLLPTNSGKFGQVICIDEEYETGFLVAESIKELVEVFANNLDENLYHLHEDALEDDNHFLEPDSTIDIINWQKSVVWKR